MKILHVLSQNQPTGTEFYLATLAKEQKKQGHELIVVSDKLHVSVPEARWISWPIDDRRFFSRIQNIQNLRRLIQDQNIEVVHAHSRAASWVCYWAVKGLDVAYVSTVHGRQHIHRSSRGSRIYGPWVMAVCENLKTHLKEELNIQSRHIEVVVNPISINSFSDKNPPSLENQKAFDSENPSIRPLVMGFAGRSTGPKGERLTQFLNEVLPHLVRDRAVCLKLAGFDFETSPDHLKLAITKAQTLLGVEIHVLGFLKNLSSFFQSLDVFVGSGRSFLEAAQQNICLVACGESLYCGPVNQENFSQAMASNFGDISAYTQEFSWNPEQVARDLLQATQDKSQPLCSRIRSLFEPSQVADQIQTLYKRARAFAHHPQPIPSLMYHRVVEPGFSSSHKTYVFQSQLREQMEWLKKSGYTSITLKEYHQFVQGECSWKEFPQKPIFISFDDGYQNNHRYLLPLIQEFGLKVTLYALGGQQITSNSWDTAQDQSEPSHSLMTEGQILDFHKVGCEIGSHGRTHRNLTELSQEEMKQEIVESKSYFEDLLGEPMVSFAYPFGKFGEREKQAVKQAGYAYGVSTDSGGLHFADDHYAIFRVNVFPEDKGRRFQKKCQPRYRLRFFRTRGR